MENCQVLPVNLPWLPTLYAEAQQKGIPLSGTFELTPRCNFHCRMCYVHLEERDIPAFGKELSAEEWIRIGREARDAGMLFLCITGGEPTLHPEFERIYTALAQMGFVITLQTNASCLGESLLRTLEEWPPAAAKITLYGSNDAVYESVCGVKNGFTRADAGIRELLRLGIPVQLVTTVIKANRTDLPAIYAYARSAHVPWYYSTAAYPSLRGAKTDARIAAIDAQTATDYQAEIREMLAHPKRLKERKPCQCCTSYRTGFWVLWNGVMNFCSFMNQPGIDVRKLPFSDAWQELLLYEEALEWPEECRSCEIRAACPDCIGKISTYSGSVHAVETERCEDIRKKYREVRE